MAHFALVSKSEPLELPEQRQAQVISSSPLQNTTRQQVTAIYESYASLYPNPKLAQEAHERDGLLRALAAASDAVQQNPVVRRKKSFFGSLFGKDESLLQTAENNTALLLADDNDEKLHYYSERNDENNDDSLCGTQYSLDASCIPQEAHSLARFHMASATSHGQGPNVARCAWPDTSSTSTNNAAAAAIIVVVVGLGLLAETSCNGKSRVVSTSDLAELEEFCAGTTTFSVARARAASIGPNFLLVSWGLSDGFVVMYRRLKSSASTSSQEERAVAWQAVAVLGPTQTVMENLGDVFGQEEGSSILQITDIVPLVVEGGEEGLPPAVTVAVARLGGFVELIPLSPRLWFGPPVNPLAKKRRKRRRQQGPPEHYAAGRMANIASNVMLGTAFSTLEYHADVISLEGLRTSVGDETSWDREAYPSGPPAEYVLTACGTRDGHEVLTFWSISFLFAESPEQVQDGVDFALHASLAEAIDLGPLGPDVSIFASPSIMSHWREPKLVKLQDGESSNGDAMDSAPVTTVSVSAPIVSVRFVSFAESTQLAVLDWNGGVTFMECSLLERFISQSLTEDEYSFLYKNEDPEAAIPMVKTTVDRSLVMRRLSGSSPLPVKATSIQWSVMPKQPSDEPMLAILTEDPSTLNVLSAGDMEDDNPLASVALSTCQRGTIARASQGSLSVLTIESSKSSPGSLLSFCALDEQDPRDIVESLARASKFKEVITSAKLLSRSEQESLANTVEKCKRNLWEASRDFESFEAILDDSYIVQQALSFTTHLDLELFRSVHNLALSRLSNTRLGPALVIGGLDGTKTVIDQVRGRLVKLGTYQLLCEYFGMTPSVSQFCGDVLPLSTKELAKSFAKTGDATALTLVCFRHKNETFLDFDVLNEIPLVAEPARFQHLFPVSGSDGSTLFLSRDSQQPLLHCSEMSNYLKSSTETALFLDDHDEGLVVDHYRCSLDLESEASGDTERGESIEQWYTARLTSIQNVSGNLKHTTGFARLAARGLHIDLDCFDSSIAPPIARLIHVAMRCSEVLGDPMSGRASNRPLPSYAALSPPTIESMQLQDIVSMILDDLDGSSDVFSSYKMLTLPLLDLVTLVRKDMEPSSLDVAIKSYCEGLVRTCFGSTFSNGAPGITPTEEASRRAIEISSAIASLSRSSRHVCDRVIKDKTVLLDLVLSVFRTMLRVFREASLKSQVVDLTCIVDGLWTMYESLPAKMPSDGLDSCEPDSLLDAVDDVFRALVAMDIFSRWPSCNPFHIDMLKPSFSEELCPSGETTVAALCLSFCTQMEGQQDVVDFVGRSELLAGLLSDISALNSQCYDASLPLSTLLSAHLLTPLMRQQQFHALGEFLTTASKEWIDGEHTSKAIVAFISEASFAKGTGNSGSGNALLCLDILGRRFPTVQNDLQAVRRLLDASHFIGGVLIPGSSVEKFRPATLRETHPLDVMESVLTASPECIVCDCKEWADTESAAHANAALRDFARLGRNAGDDTLRSNASSLPPLPGRALFHLAELLGLNEGTEVIAVKCRVIHHATSADLHGAAAAVCRTLIATNALSDSSCALPILNAVATVVSHPMYADVETKRELCLAVATDFAGSLRLPQSSNFERILTSLIESEELSPQLAGDKRSAFDRLCRDTLMAYSEDIYKGFTKLRQQAPRCTVDDTLVCSLSRYAFLWCIAKSAEVRATDTRRFEPDSTDWITALATSLFLHVEKKGLAAQCLEEVVVLLEEQTNAARIHSSSDFIVPDTEIVRRLIGRGYSKNGACRAAAMSGNTSFDVALQWAVTHSLDRGFDEPLVFVKSEQRGSADKHAIERLKQTLAYAVVLLQGTDAVAAFTGATNAPADKVTADRSATLQFASTPVLSPVHTSGQSPVVQSRSPIQAAVPQVLFAKKPPAKLKHAIMKAGAQVPSKPLIRMATKLATPHISAVDQSQASPRLVAPKVGGASAKNSSDPSAKISSLSQPTADAPQAPIATKLTIPAGTKKVPVSTKLTAPAKAAKIVPTITKPVVETAVANGTTPTLPNDQASALAVKPKAPSRLVVPSPSSRPVKAPSTKSLSPTASAPGLLPETSTESPDRSLLLDRGQTILQASRTAASPASDERRRLIEEGRRLLRKARATGVSTTTTAKTVNRYPLRSKGIPSVAQGNDSPPPASASTHSPVVPAADNTTDQNDDAWDFDDF